MSDTTPERAQGHPVTGLEALAHIARMAPIWRARKPSGRFILQRLPHDRWCPMHGQVTKHHFCQVSCAVSWFKCVTGCNEAKCKGVTNAKGAVKDTGTRASNRPRRPNHTETGERQVSKGMTIFENEGDVRAWVRSQESPKFRWVEPARGATLGIPDCWCLLPHGLGPLASIRTVWFELKCAEYDLLTGMIRYKVRPAQKREIEELDAEGGHVFLLVGEENRSNLWLLRPDLAQATGWIDLNHVISEGLCWRVGLGKTSLGQTIQAYWASKGAPIPGPEKNR